MIDKRVLDRLEVQRDIAFCGFPLTEDRATFFASEGAHDPTGSRYFVLEQLFAYFSFTKDSHLLDVGCGAGRALAYFVQAGFSGRATGVDLDGSLVERAKAWSSRYSQISVVHDNVLDLPLADYTDFYLFNPFDTRILLQFLEKVEWETAHSPEHPVTLVHASDNGENYSFMGRTGWSLKAEGWIQKHEGAVAFDCPQHWSVWELS